MSLDTFNRVEAIASKIFYYSTLAVVFIGILGLGYLMVKFPLSIFLIIPLIWLYSGMLCEFSFPDKDN